MRNHCEGCYSYEKDDEIINCEIVKFNDTDKCPCSHCLIKVMCKLGCDEFEIYYSKALKELTLDVFDFSRGGQYK